MKKVVITLLIFLILGLAGLAGYVMMLMQDTPASADPVQSSASAKESQVKFGFTKEIKTDADEKDAIAFWAKENRDTVGWLRIPDTNINNSVMQAHDNLYYLRRNEKKEYDIYGCYFADYEASIGDRETMSPNTVIYGHSDLKDSADGPKFSQLFRFTKEDFARSHPYLYFTTPEENMTWQIFAVFYTEASMDYISAEPTPERFQKMIAEAKSRSLYTYEEQVTPEDKILTLSTCTVEYGDRNDQRFVVMAKLMPTGHKPQEQASLTPNPTPKQPKF